MFLSRVNVKLPTVEVRYKNLFVEAECEVVGGKPLPTLWNSLLSFLSVSVFWQTFRREMFNRSSHITIEAAIFSDKFMTFIL